ncbi:MAG: hypothetical protein DRJ15_02830 [Bacteroidetes bacterium]|nr:MAG: hypothetical protein DRJ15_02830 [Bacteroidota bacterium]
MKQLLWLLIVLTGLPASGQYDYSLSCERAHALVTSLRFEEARIVLDSVKSDDPGNLVPILLENYIDFLTIIVGENETEFNKLEHRLNDRIDLLKEGDKSSPWYRSTIAQVYLQWAFARVKFGEYFTAGREIRRAFLLLEENRELHPGFLPDQVGLGIMHALIGSIPDNYRWIANLFSMGGSVEQGRDELLDVLHRADADGYPYLRDEALFFISFVELNLQADMLKAQELLPYYGDGTSENLMLVFSKAKILMRTSRNDEAIELLLARPKGEAYFPFYYLDFLTGLAKLNRMDEDAHLYFLRFTMNFKGNAYVKEAYQKLGWHCLLQGKTEAYHEYMQKVIRYGNDFADGDKLALAEAESGRLPNTCLLRARLLYDGGYYPEADSVLDNFNCLLESDRDRVEYPYRKGRIAHARGEHATAIAWYEEAISKGEDMLYYFAANAALQTGNIYEMQEKYDLAEDLYKRCIRMPNREYRRSMQQKAKAGLNRLKDKRKNSSVN